MELPVDAIVTELPSAINREAVESAYRRADGLMRSYQMRHAWVRNRLAHQFVQEALNDKLDNAPLETKVARLVKKRISDWLEQIAAQAGLHFDNRTAERLQLTLMLSHFCERWPEAFLQTELPPEAIESIQAFDIQPYPTLERSSLGPSVLDFGAAESVANSARSLYSRWPVLRAVTFYTTMIGLAIVIYILAR